MMRFLLIAGLFLMLTGPQAWAQTTHQYPNPYRQTWWNNMTDSMHTLGQNPQQARLTKMKLHHQRVMTREKNIHHANMAAFKAKRQSWLNSQQ